MNAERAFAWAGEDEWHGEQVALVQSDDGMVARGVQLGADPEPYRVEYELTVDAGWITRRLLVAALGAGWSSYLELAHDGDGNWVRNHEPETSLEGALDCDIAHSPLTNTMPVMRHRLHEQPGAADFTMAWVSLPDLDVHPAPQRYEHVRTTETGSVVRYRSTGEGETFEAELELDRDGFVVFYPQLARRVGEKLA